MNPSELSPIRKGDFRCMKTSELLGTKPNRHGIELTVEHRDEIKSTDLIQLAGFSPTRERRGDARMQGNVKC